MYYLYMQKILCNFQDNHALNTCAFHILYQYYLRAVLCIPGTDEAIVLIIPIKNMRNTTCFSYNCTNINKNKKKNTQRGYIYSKYNHPLSVVIRTLYNILQMYAMMCVGTRKARAQGMENVRPDVRRHAQSTCAGHGTRHETQTRPLGRARQKSRTPELTLCSQITHAAKQSHRDVTLHSYASLMRSANNEISHKEKSS